MLSWNMGNHILSDIFHIPQELTHCPHCCRILNTFIEFEHVLFKYQPSLISQMPCRYSSYVVFVMPGNKQQYMVQYENNTCGLEGVACCPLVKTSYVSERY